MLDVLQFREFIVKPSLTAINLWSQEAENLLVGTAIMESGLIYLAQIPSGVARGLFQMEQITYSDLLHTLQSKKALLEKVLAFLNMEGLPSKYDYLMGNAYAACIFARLKYLTAQAPIPLDVEDQAIYWSKYYQTDNNANQIGQYVLKYNMYHA